MDCPICRVPVDISHISSCPLRLLCSTCVGRLQQDGTDRCPTCAWESGEEVVNQVSAAAAPPETQTDGMNHPGIGQSDEPTGENYQRIRASQTQALEKCHWIAQAWEQAQTRIKKEEEELIKRVQRRIEEEETEWNEQTQVWAQVRVEEEKKWRKQMREWVENEEAEWHKQAEVRARAQIEKEEKEWNKWREARAQAREKDEEEWSRREQVRRERDQAIPTQAVTGADQRTTQSASTKKGWGDTAKLICLFTLSMLGLCVYTPFCVWFAVNLCLWSGLPGPLGMFLFLFLWSVGCVSWCFVFYL